MKRAALALVALLAGCNSGAMTTEEIKAAATDRARQELDLAANAPLEATVWTGSEYDGEASVCGTVSSNTGQVPPQRFMARMEPFEWLVFEGAHDPMTSAQPDKFPSWEQYCSSGAGTAAASTTENAPCGTRLDANQNGRVEQAEYHSFGFAFDNWDTNNDYSVSAEEFGRCWPNVASAPAATGFELFDEDSTGRLSQEEFFAAGRFRQFAQLRG